MYLPRKLNLHLVFICLISFLFFLGSCSSSEDGEELSEIKNVSRELLIGTWEAPSTAIIAVVYTFKDDGTGITLETKNMSWRLDANILTITRNGSPNIFQIIEIDNKIMLLQYSDGQRTKFTKK